MGTNVFRKGIRAVAVTAVVLAVGACGVKSSPRFPEGSTYPHTYPTAGPERGTALPSSSPSSETAPDKTRESDRDARSPLGFPLEYPNRPSYN